MFTVDCDVLERRWRGVGGGGQGRSHSLSSTLQGSRGGVVAAWAFTPCSKISLKEKQPYSLLHSDLYLSHPARDPAGEHTPVSVRSSQPGKRWKSQC